VNCVVSPLHLSAVGELPVSLNFTLNLLGNIKHVSIEICNLSCH